MKILNPVPKFLIYAVFQAVMHPRTPITYYCCSHCKLRFNATEEKCPKCHDKVGSSPETRHESPVPWWAAVLCIIIGIGAWIASAYLEIPELSEAAHALVYIPLGSLFGMSMPK